MSTFLIPLLVAVGMAFIIGRIVLALNGDDGRAWSHNALSDEEHRWE